MKNKKQLSPAKSAVAEDTQELAAEITLRHPKVQQPLQHLTRLFVIFFASLGINRLLADALQTEHGFFMQVLPLVFWLTVLALFFHSKKGFLGGLALTLTGFGGIWLTTHQDPIRYLASGIALIWNRFMTIIDSMGYMSLSKIGEGLSLTEESLFFTLSLISCLVFFLSLWKKARIFPILIYLILVCAPVFIYNMPEKNDGIALLAAALTGIVVMRLSEKHTKDTRSSGFMGATALLLAFLLLLAPMLHVKEPWGDIPGIAEQIEELRVIITQLAEGKLPSFSIGDDFETYNTPRSTVATRRNFRGTQILTAYADANAPLYLREWVGGEYRNNSWYMPDIATIDPLYRPLSPEANPYYVTENFLKAYEAMTGNDGEEAMGLFRGNIAVEPASVGGLMPIPVTTVSELFSPAGYNRIAPSYQVHSDFIYASNRLTRKNPYEVLAVLPYRYTTAAYDEFLEAFYRYILFTQDGVMPEYGTLARRMAMHFGKDGLESTVATSLARDKYADSLYGSLQETAVIDRIVEELFRTTDIAKYYNLSSYGSDAEMKSHTGVITVTDEGGKPQTYYLSSLAEVMYADEVARIVADFLGNRCTYTLDPKEATVSDAMEEFLFYGKEGYCVQFATASTLMMRRLGFTARYAEGYIAEDFSYNRDSNYTQAYAARVRDHNAHAWMEVWVSGFGWKLIEVTPGYTEGFYLPGDTAPDDPYYPEESTDPSHDTEDPAGTTEPNHDPGDPDDPLSPITTTPNTEVPTAPTEPTDLTPWLIRLLIAAPLILALLLLIRRGIHRRTAKEQRICLAGKGCPTDKRQELAAKLADDVSAALRAYRLVPKAGERPSAFGERADLALAAMHLDPAVSRAVDALSRLVYGGLAEDEDLAVLAAVTDALMKQAKRRLGIIRFLYCRWIVCTV